MKDCNYSERVAGVNYVEFLRVLHGRLKPATYFEIGVQFGDTLKLANCATICVDPRFQCEINVLCGKPVCHCYQMTSDEFFGANNPTAIFGRPIDFAFLDGMHWFEFLLRDFINTEKHCASRSTIVMHDCLPPGFYMTTRDNDAVNHPESDFKGWWAGDVWKIVPTLIKYRPDLSISITDCAPTGLVIVTNLNPDDTILTTNYNQILTEFKEMDREEFEHYWKNVFIDHAA
ncbi:class I SAM-dependent methyltransferase [Rhodoblastus sp.]|jgi:hypothetical protein|uniref:class I SAM-dependent methyltransferase n=1 Tax=Rhodoblastus sp. TaxID=1962975 RepID=UPI0025CDA66F|nr:class I SAM-dependent methyltransferase [Rhodoblastus sp.]